MKNVLMKKSLMKKITPFLLFAFLLFAFCTLAFPFISAMPPELIGQHVASAYGDNNAKVVRVVKTTTEQRQPMYIIFLQGHFHKGNLTSTRLEFSALRNEQSIWAISASDDNNHDVWQDLKVIPRLPQ